METFKSQVYKSAAVIKMLWSPMCSEFRLRQVRVPLPFVSSRKAILLLKNCQNHSRSWRGVEAFEASLLSARLKELGLLVCFAMVLQRHQSI